MDRIIFELFIIAIGILIMFSADSSRESYTRQMKSYDEKHGLPPPNKLIWRVAYIIVGLVIVAFGFIPLIYTAVNKIGASNL
jgi:uncharacterized membrane protein YidH (DUF202 family)